MLVGRRNEVVSFVGQEGGLKDLSISRTTFSWGIPVPNDPKHVVYVWLDALTNYMAALGYGEENEDGDSSQLFKKYWPASLHVVGKDILRFHAVFWPAFLMAADIKLPERIYAHGWWTKDGEKMSKSIGNVLDPFELINKYGVDYLRYYLATEIHFGNDGDFSDESFANRINSDLANDIGNLVQRVLTMISKNCDGKIPSPALKTLTQEDRDVLVEASNLLPDIRDHMFSQNIKSCNELIVNLAKIGNRYIDTQAPWALLKTDQERMRAVLYVLTELLRVIGILLEPTIPTSSEHMLNMLGISKDKRTFESITAASPIKAPIENTIAMSSIGQPSPIFPKIEREKKEKEKGNNKEEREKGSIKKEKKKKENKVPDVIFTEYDDLKIDELEQKIAKVGDKIREMKATGASKDSLTPNITELKYLKYRYEVVSNGIPFKPKK